MKEFHDNWIYVVLIKQTFNILSSFVKNDLGKKKHKHKKFCKKMT